MHIVFQDEFLIAVDKPAGLFVHPHFSMPSMKDTVLSRVRNMVGRRVYTVHRLDRPTSGVLLLAKDPETARLISAQFESRVVEKTYLAVVRGHVAPEGYVDHPVPGDEDSLVKREAQTTFERLETLTLPFPIGPYPEARYSFLRLRPRTGRFHQLRRHMHHISHPVIGDSNYGDLRHNHFFRDVLGVSRLMLFAESLTITHPRAGTRLRLAAPTPRDFSLGRLKAFSQMAAGIPIGN